MGFGLRVVGVCSALVLVTGLGCQRIPSENDDGSPPDSGGAGNLDDEGGGTFLEGGQASAAEDEDDSAGVAECSVVAQTGCAPNQKCTVTTAGGGVEATCVVDPSEHDPFGACTPTLGSGIDGCPAGHACLGSDGAGLCLPLCLNDSTCGGGLCVLDPLDNVPHCATACSPFMPSCPEPLECRRKDDQYGCVFAGDEDIGGAGDPCILEGDTGCATGFACIAGALLTNCSEDRCCTRLCDLDALDNCPDGTTCVPAIDAPGPGAENVGACFVPS